MKKLMSTLQRWGVLGLGVLSGHGVTASEAHLSDDAFNQLNLDNLPNMEASLNMDVNNLYAGHRSHRVMVISGVWGI